jgi:hypothetical protein
MTHLSLFIRHSQLDAATSAAFQLIDARAGPTQTERAARSGEGGRSMRNKAFWMLIAGLLAVPAAEAASVNGRQIRQRERIRQGVRSGELTRRETLRLRAEQRGLRAEERFYRRTGPGLSRSERRDLQRDLNRTSRDIYRQKHDRQDR